MHLLALVDPIDGTYQRRMNRQLTVQESRHRLARKICHGNRGQIRQPYREGQEDQLAALGLVLNAVVLWNTRYLDAIVEQLRGAGDLAVRDEDVARLSPLGHAHPAVDPDTVSVESKCVGVTVDGKIGSVTYLDTVVSTPAGWRIGTRIVQARRRPLNGLGT